MNSTRSRGVAALMALSLALMMPARPVTAAAPSPEEKTRAREHYQKGLTHYDIKEYSDALTEFKNAYRVVQDPAFLFNIAQCYRKLGQDIEALDYYRNYLRRFPTAPNRGEVERRIQEIERELAVKAPAAGAPPPAVQPSPSRPPPGPVTPLAPPPAPSAAPPVLPAPPIAATTAPPPAAVVTASPAASDGEDEPAFYQRWWFWTGVGAVVAVAVVTGIAVATRGEVGDCLGISPCRTVGD